MENGADNIHALQISATRQTHSVQRWSEVSLTGQPPEQSTPQMLTWLPAVLVEQVLVKLRAHSKAIEREAWMFQAPRHTYKG